MARLEHSVRPSFHVDRQFAHQYDAFVRLSPLYQHLVQELIARVQIRQGMRVLCLASGTGLDARAVADAGAARVFGLDRSLSMVHAAREASDAYANVHFIHGDAAAIPFPNAYFDVVLINAAGNYLWDSIYTLFADVQRVLKPGGVFAFNCQSDEIESEHPDDPQRQVRRLAYLLGQQRGYPVRLSAKPSIPFIAQIADGAGLTLVDSMAVKVATNVDDVLQQLLLPQFHVPFIGGVPEHERDALLRDAASGLTNQGYLTDAYRSWDFFVFEKQAEIVSA